MMHASRMNRSIMMDALDQLDVPLKRDVPLGSLTWYGVGGLADALAEPRDEHELCRLMQLCHELRWPVYILGKGANLLVADDGVRGVVIQLTAPTFRQITIDQTTVTVGGGADLEKLITTCVRAGLAGLEGLGGIPASVGGAVRMNAGGKFGEIGTCVQSIRCVTGEGQIIAHARDVLEFAYRYSNITEPIILEATFELRQGDAGALRDALKQVFAYKKESQPLAARSAGCVFKNSPVEQSKKPAGQLIDEAGLKGHRIGSATVSQHHANFIVLEEDGHADDAIQLIKHIQQQVLLHSGVQLQREVVLWGADDNG